MRALSQAFSTSPKSVVSRLFRRPFWHLLSFVLLVLFGFFLTSCLRKQASSCTLRVAIAASLTLPLQKIAKAYEKQNACRVLLDIGSSGLLRRKIQRGASYDLFLSADVIPPNTFQRHPTAQIQDFASNRLVLLAAPQTPHPQEKTHPKQPPRTLTPRLRAWLLRSSTRLVIGDPMHVPAGRYAQAALRKMKLWTSLQKRIIRAAHVRAALRTLLQGHAQAAVVYTSDAHTAPQAHILYTFPHHTHPPIRYQLAQINQKPQTKAFSKLLLLQRSTLVYLFQAGFLPPLRRPSAP